MKQLTSNNGLIRVKPVALLLVIIMIGTVFSGISMGQSNLEEDIVNIEPTEIPVFSDENTPYTSENTNGFDSVIKEEPAIISEASASEKPDAQMERYYSSYIDEHGELVTTWEYVEIEKSPDDEMLFSNPPISPLSTPNFIIQPNATEGKDSSIYEGVPDLNRGNDDFLTVSTGGDTQGLIEFNISSASFLDNENITSVYLNIFHSLGHEM